MKRSILPAVCSLLAVFGALPRYPAMPTAACATPAPADRVAAPFADKVIDALEAWWKAWRAGKIDFTKKESISKDSIAGKKGLLPKGMVGDLTYARELELLFEQAVKLESAEAATTLLQFASAGLDEFKYTRSMAPFAVRGLAETWLMKFTGQAALDEITKAARGELRVGKDLAAVMKAAALRSVGKRKDKALRAVLEQQLGATELTVRLAAAEGLRDLGDEDAGPALAAALERETTDQCVDGIVMALRASYARYLQVPAPEPTPTPKGPEALGDKPAEPGKEPGKEPVKPAEPAPAPAPAVPEAPESARLAVRAAIGALGRTNWRADMTLVQFLDDFRSPETIPALIAILQKCKDNPADLQSGKLSGLLLHRAHEVLVSMTGAVFPADKPEKWREFWEAEKGKIQVASKAATEASKAKSAANTVSTGFCGIPVQGTRIVFILDLSGSMDFPMRKKGTAGEGVPDKLPSRLDFAKKELIRAMEAMSTNAQFNLVTFNGNPKPELWNKTLVPANDKNRERFRKYVEDLRADGATNLWCGLEEGLKLKSLVYGNRYDTNVDELFILSDGAPTAGDVMDPIEILRLVKETNRFSKVRINTVYISSPNPRDLPPTPWMTITPEAMMERMADENGGKFVNL
ncbi:MAG: VWA domain-containing protein [Planctomycetes bacterium]|nr:VWA domain-containing protein [Planctomycetota bacterium]